MKNPSSIVWFILLGCLTLASAGLLAHETKEVAGLVVVFGAEPEPALTSEVEHLRWRFRSKDSEEPFGDLEALEAVVKHDGKEFGPFEVRMVRREPGLFQTTHIFTGPGQYEAALTFRKKGDPQGYAVDFTYRIRDRRDLEIPE